MFNRDEKLGYGNVSESHTPTVKHGAKPNVNYVQDANRVDMIHRTVNVPIRLVSITEIVLAPLTSANGPSNGGHIW